MSTTDGPSPGDGREVTAGDSGPEAVSSSITVHRSSPDRVVFVAEGNSDAWIATDVTVELRR